MNLLSETELIKTSRVDHADWNYRPLLRCTARRRFALILSLFPKLRVPNILEVGFGSGVFMPELAMHCDDLYGIDVHSHVSEVKEHLAAKGIRANLFCMDAARTTFPDASFDIIVAVSALEFITNIDAAAREMARLLKPKGCLLAVLPPRSPLLDLTLRVFTGEDAERDYGNRRESVIPALKSHFRVIREKRFFPVYTAYQLSPRGALNEDREEYLGLEP